METALRQRGGVALGFVKQPENNWDYAQNGSEAAQDVEVLRLVN
jgi:hypothetical protein